MARQEKIHFQPGRVFRHDDRSNLANRHLAIPERAPDEFLDFDDPFNSLISFRECMGGITSYSEAGYDTTTY